MAPFVPAGYVSFPELPYVVRANARSEQDWKLKLPFDVRELNLTGDRTVRPDGVEAHYIIGGVSEWKHALGPLLAAGELVAAGILVDSGDLVQCPPQTWRTPLCLQPQFRFPIEAAFEGDAIPFRGPRQPEILCLPTIALRDLAQSFGAETLPDEPVIRPEQSWNGGPTSGGGGRPPKYDWDQFWVEVAHYAARNDLEPAHRAELQTHMENWTGERWAPPPGASTIRSKLKLLYPRDRK